MRTSENPDEVVDVIKYKTPSGILLTVRASRLNERWLKLLFTHNSNPFKVLKEMGFNPEIEMNFPPEITQRKR